MLMLRIFLRKLYEQSGYWALLHLFPVLFYLVLSTFQTRNTEQSALTYLNERTPSWVIWAGLSSIMTLVFLYGLLRSIVIKRTG